MAALPLCQFVKTCLTSLLGFTDALRKSIVESYWGPGGGSGDPQIYYILQLLRYNKN